MEAMQVGADAGPAPATAVEPPRLARVDRQRLVAAFRVLGEVVPAPFGPDDAPDDAPRPLLVRLTVARGRLQVSASEGGDGACAVVDLGRVGGPALDVEVSHQLVDYLDELDGEQVDLGLAEPAGKDAEPRLLVVSPGGPSFWLTGSKPTWPVPRLDPTGDEVDGSALMVLLDAVHRFCHTDDSRPNLKGVFLRCLPGMGGPGGEHGIESVGTDGHRLAIHTLTCPTGSLPDRRDGSGGAEGFRVPAKLVCGLLTLLTASGTAAQPVAEDRAVRWLIGGGRIGAAVGPVLLSTNDPLHAYPDYGQVVPQRWAARTTVARETLLQAARRFDAAAGAAGHGHRAAVLLESAGEVLRLSVTMAVVINDCRRTDGEASDSVHAHTEGDALSVRLAAHYLVESLEALAPAADVVIEHLGGLSPVLLYAEGGPRHVIMPMRGE